MSILVIHNPVAGRKKLINNVGYNFKNYLLKNNIKYRWLETLPQDVQPFSELHPENFERVIVIGGDGTVREVVNYIVKHKLNTKVAIIPTGSANILALSLNIPVVFMPFSFKKAVYGNSTKFDVGFANDKYVFLIGCGKGHDAMLMKAAKRSLKRKFGNIAYLFAFFRQIFHFRRLKYKLIVDGKIYKFKARTVLVFNLLNIFGLFRKYKFDANDGLLNIVILQTSAFWSLMKTFSLFFTGNGENKKSGVRLLKGKKIEIYTKQRNIPVEIDGEVFEMERLKIEIISRAVEIVS